MCHRKFLLKLTQNRELIKTQCNDQRNPFHFAYRQWYSYNNPKCFRKKVYLHLFDYK